MNKTILIGRLTKDPEIRYTQSKEPLAVASYTLAVNRRCKRDNEPDADFILCVTFGKSAEFAEEYLKKGMQICVVGRISVRSWDDPKTNQRRWQTEVIVEEQEFTESRRAFESRQNGSNASRQATQQGSPSDSSESYAGIADSIENVDERDLPF